MNTETNIGFHIKHDPLTDGISNVSYVDHMGSDLSVVNAARVSMDKESKWEFDEDGSFTSKHLSAGDVKLINYLATHNHWTPFGHAHLSLRVKAPIYVARQLVKHQVGFCLTGDTEVTFVRVSSGVSNGTYTRTMADMFAMWSGQVKYQGGEKGKLNIRNSHVRVYSEGSERFETSHVVDVMQTGVKRVYLVKDVYGKGFKASADHQVMTQCGWVKVEDLTPMVDSFITHDRGQSFGYAESIRGSSADVIARRTFRAENIGTKYQLDCPKCDKTTLTSDMEVDHILPVSTHPELVGDKTNLQMLCRSCHVFKTQVEKAEPTTTLLPRYARISLVKYVGEEMCYDLSIENEHNFLANGAVVHNCWNEVSRRYVDTPPEIYIPDFVAGRADKVKQGSTGAAHGNSEEAVAMMRVVCGDAVELYNDLIKDGVAPEDARMILPLNMYTEWVWSGSLAAWARVANLRRDPHSQRHTRAYGEAISSVVSRAFPIAFAALTKGA
jgi:flavin-dependent thymidylate synthase